MNSSKVLENAVLLRLSFSRVGNCRKGDLSKVETDADKQRLKLGKVLFVSKEYAAVQSFDNALSAWVASRAVSVDVGLRGTVILPRALLADVDGRLSRAVEERAALVESFLTVYPEEIEKARERMNGQFRADDYPPADEVRRAFGFAWYLIQFGPADGLPPELAERERAKISEKFAEVEADVTSALRESFAELVGHLAERLAVGADGKPRIFRDSAVGNLVEFLELFSARNITSDADLAALAEKARAVVAGVSPDKLRSRQDVRGAVRSGLEEVKAAVDKLIETQPRRRFNLDD